MGDFEGETESDKQTKDQRQVSVEGEQSEMESNEEMNNTLYWNHVARRARYYRLARHIVGHIFTVEAKLMACRKPSTKMGATTPPRSVPSCAVSRMIPRPSTDTSVVIV